MLEIIDGRENHSRRADTALSATILIESVLDGMKLSIRGESFDGCYVLSISLADRHHAAQNKQAIHDDGAGTALSFPAAFLRSRESEILTKYVQEALHRRDRNLPFFVVDGDRKRSHARSSSFMIRSGTSGISLMKRPPMA